MISGILRDYDPDHPTHKSSTSLELRIESRELHSYDQQKFLTRFLPHTTNAGLTFVSAHLKDHASLCHDVLIQSEFAIEPVNRAVSSKWCLDLGDKVVTHKKVVI